MGKVLRAMSPKPLVVGVEAQVDGRAQQRHAGVAGGLLAGVGLDVLQDGPRAERGAGDVDGPLAVALLQVLQQVVELVVLGADVEPAALAQQPAQAVPADPLRVRRAGGQPHALLLVSAGHVHVDEDGRVRREWLPLGLLDEVSAAQALGHPPAAGVIGGELVLKLLRRGEGRRRGVCGVGQWGGGQEQGQQGDERGAAGEHVVFLFTALGYVHA